VLSTFATGPKGLPDSSLFAAARHGHTLRADYAIVCSMR